METSSLENLPAAWNEAIFQFCPHVSDACHVDCAENIPAACALMQRIAEGEVRLVHVPDDENPSDFLTKWVPAAKLRASLRYATGAAAQ